MSTYAASSSAVSPTAKPAKSFVAHAKLIGLLTLLSRILGMARESVSAKYFGAGLVSSAFIVAFSIPNLFRKLFGEGALSAAFIPLYTKALKAENSTDSANHFAAASVNLLCVMLLLITVAGEGVIWGVCHFASHIRLDQLLTLKFTAIMLPYVLLICGTAFLSSILQVHRRFGLPAFAPVLLNVIHITVIALGARFLHLQIKPRVKEFDPATVAGQTTLAYWLCFFVLVAGVLQVAILLPALKQVGFRLRWVPHFWTPPVKQMLKMSVPVALGAGVLQISVLMDKALSLMLAQSADKFGNLIDTFHFFGHTVRYPMELGAAARLNWAQFLYQFPLGVFAIALATAIFPGLSADALDRDRSAFKAVLRQGVEATMFEGLAASIGLMIVALPAAKLLFQHGDITPHDSQLIARSVIFYSSAIWAFSLLQITNRAYYALHDTKTPLVMSIMNIAINLIVELPLIWLPGIGEAGMAVGTCVSFAIQAVIMLWILDRRIGGLELRRSAPSVIKMLGAALKGGPRYGIDFSGGAVMDLRWEGAPPIERLRAAVSARAPGASVVAAHDLTGSNDVLISAELTADGDMAALRQSLDQAVSTVGTRYSIRGFEAIGPQIGADLRRQALLATAGASGGMLLYLAWRFRAIYGVAAVAAMAHDAFLTIGLFSLLHQEISLTVVAALLTLIGYSMNDTIVVFDRIRENRRQGGREPLAETINRSINQTLSRTVLTSGLTLLTALSLLLFAGPVLRGFSLALSIGIVVGTFSSIFIASPILLAWESRAGWSARHAALPVGGGR